MTRAAVVFAALMSCIASAAFAQNVSSAQVAPSAAEPARDSGIDYTLGAGIIRDSDKHAFAGIRSTTAFNISEAFAFIVEAEWLVAVAERASSGRVIRDNELTALGGIRLRKFMESPAVPYLQVSAGYAGRKDNALQLRRSLFAFRTDGGLDVQLTPHFGIRAGIGWTFLFADVPYRSQLGGTIGGTISLGKR